MTDFSTQNRALTLRLKYNIFTSMESPAPSRPGATPNPCQPLTFFSCFFLPGHSAPAPLASAVPPLSLLLPLPRIFLPVLLACLIFLLSTVTTWQNSYLSPRPPPSRALALSPLPLIVRYPIQFSHLCFSCVASLP